MWPINRSYQATSFDPGRGPVWDWGHRTYVMGIVNATHDSFSGDGIDGQIDKAVLLATEFEACGVDVIDIGGASSRPGAVGLATSGPRVGRGGGALGGCPPW